MAYLCLSRALPGLAASAIATAALAGPAKGEPLQRSEPVPPELHLEMWSGGEVFAAVWSAYGGASWAPFGSVGEDGLRLRVVLGTGAYRHGQAAFSDVLIGYHKQLGPVTLKVFGGLTVAEHFPTEPTSMLAGTALGPKVLLETWWTISDKTWTSLDLGVALPHLHMAEPADTDRVDYTGRIRLGWRLWPELSIGLEGGAGGPLAPALPTIWQNGMARAGGFLRYEWASGEVSISGGVLVEGDGGEGHTHPFGTVSVLTRF
jgi:hypothetical protein